MQDRSHLRIALGANAIFSATTGLVLVTGLPAAWLGIPGWISVALGAVLLGFAALVAAARRTPHRSLVRQIVAADAAWVVGAAALLALWPAALSPAGRWALAGSTAVVAALAAAQWTASRGERDRIPATR